MEDQRTDRTRRLEIGCVIAGFVATAIIASAFGFIVGTLDEHATWADEMSKMRTHYEKKIEDLQSQKK